MRSTSNEFNMVLRFLPLLITVTILLLSACTSCTKPQTGTIKGRVAIEVLKESALRGPVDFSGIIVAVYQVVQVDTTLARLNNSYPNIGVIVNQETEFDHRKHAPVAKVEPNEYGEFQFDNLEQGSYNLVFISDSLSIRYIYDVPCKYNSPTDVGVVELRAKVTLPAFISTAIEFQSGVQYYSSEDVNILGDAVFQRGAVISLAPGKSLKLHGSVSSSDTGYDYGFWKMTSAYGLSDSDPVAINKGHYMQSLAIYSPAADIRNLAISYSDFGISAMGDSITVNRAYMNNITYGIYTIDCTANIRNVILKNGTTYNCYLQSSTQLCSVSNSIFLGSDEGLGISGGTYTLFNSYFYKCYAAFRPYDNSGSIEHCAFEQNNYDIYQYRCSCIIRYNNFYHSKIIGLRPRNYGLVNYNNFYRTDKYYIDIRGLAMPGDLDAKQNYWAEEDLDSYLNDALDNDSFPDEPPYTRYVIYNPRRAFPLAEAGIQ